MLNNQNEQKFIKKRSKVINNSMQYDKNSFFIDNLVNDLQAYLSNMVSEKVAFKASSESREVFSYYLDSRVEEIVLIIEKKYNLWNVIFKVCPTYLDNSQNFRRIQDFIEKNVIILSLKDFYFNNVNKYYN